ncbi:MAG: aminotransferase class I/II-fold pyridoxal phosphate-dependent enzyme, partial [Alphaproteobacteria bacterium]|nr:aminotransferase class I/II-fold pyridoxal phosphate-dependent enzyme [Alphaproteobacteria bacterium]
LNGTLELHHELERRFARFLGKEAAICVTTGFTTNLATLSALLGRGDVVFSDRQNHASLVDGIHLSYAEEKRFRHNDMAQLEKLLRETDPKHGKLIVTDGVFSMEGDLAPLPGIVALARKHGAAIILDDSHGTGVMGAHGRGTAEHFGVEGDIDIVTGTLGKALGGAAGGYVAGSKTLTDFLSQVSRPQLFSNALPATIAASAMKAIEILEREPERVARLHAITRMLRDGLKERGFKPLDGDSAIVPIIVGDTAFAIRMSKALLDEGIFITGFGYPVVPEGTARLRIQACASLTDAQIAFALAAFEKVGRRLGIVS